MVGKVCVIGARGFLGTAITEELERRGIEWCGITSGPTTKNNEFEFSKFDQEKVISEVEGCSLYINAAGRWKPNTCEGSPGQAIGAMIEFANKVCSFLCVHKAKKFLHLSSAGTVYGEQNGRAHREDDLPTPISWYGRGKLLEEAIYSKYTDSNDIQFVCARITNPFGNVHNAVHGFVDVLLSSVANARKFSVFKGVNPSRDFILAADVAYYIVELLMQDCSGTYNVGSGVSVRTKDICDFVSSLTGFDLIDKSLTHPYYDVVTNEVDTSKLQQVCESKSTTDVFDYIRQRVAS
ncbi:NAD-dependent epimerase/dehydratase family protein [Microbulbifer sp. EKSA005]|uniref:NAD-dependent epimerase/dehydratase family protein n=1 Tax=Microbulbifer sp. EKSA005 TaxID=3243364 RepID=UPI004041B84A